MSIDIKDVDNGLGNIITMSGVITDNELVEILKTHLTQEPGKYKLYRYSLTDMSKVTKINISTAAIEEHASACIRSAEINPDALVAVVAPEDLGFGLARMWEILSDEISWETCVFRNVEEARMWIKELAKERWKLTDLTIGCTGRP